MIQSDEEILALVDPDASPSPMGGTSSITSGRMLSLSPSRSSGDPTAQVGRSCKIDLRSCRRWGDEPPPTACRGALQQDFHPQILGCVRVVDRGTGSGTPAGLKLD